MNKWQETKYFSQQFNFFMLEITLALVVVMLAIFGVSSMFPVGMSTQKQAVGTSYMTDAAEQLLRLNASYIKNDSNNSINEYDRKLASLSLQYETR